MIDWMGSYQKTLEHDIKITGDMNAEVGKERFSDK
jgi:hypothetical protein